MDEAIVLIRNSEGVEFAQSLADRYILRSKACLDQLPESAAKKSLLEIANFIGKRQY